MSILSFTSRLKAPMQRLLGVLMMTVVALGLVALGVMFVQLNVDVPGWYNDPTNTTSQLVAGTALIVAIDCGVLAIGLAWLHSQSGNSLLRLLAEEGARRCAYAPGAGDADKWQESRCDCKYLGPFLGRPKDVRPNSELTGCCEIRAAYTVVKEHCRS